MVVAALPVHEASSGALADGGALDAAFEAALAGFRRDPGPRGAMVLRGLPLGTVPTTPASPTAPTDKDDRSERTLLAVASHLGEAVGYVQEHGGSVVQNLVPTKADVGSQTSTSSGVDLAFHTETAFHPHRPRYLLLLCLRGDPAAATTLASLDDLAGGLSPDALDSLRAPLFRTAVDESFGGDPAVPVGAERPVIESTDDGDALCWDAELTTGATPRAMAALEELTDAIATRHHEVVLEAGDLLVVDNHRCVHGRSAFAARFDGTDRWLQRTFVVEDLAPSVEERDGRIITTSFA